MVPFTLHRSPFTMIVMAGLWCGGAAVEAAALSLTASVDRTTVAINQPLTLTITLSGELPRLEAPPEFDIPAPFVVAARSQSTTMSFGAGAVTQSVSLIYVLVSPQAGTFTLGPFSLDVQGTPIQTQSFSIVVQKPVLPPGAGRQPRVTL